MNIYDYAMQMEKDGEAFYRDMARQSPESGLRNILIKLADAEVKHYNVILALKEGREEAADEGTLRADVGNLFTTMVQSGEKVGGAGSQVALYREALGIEIKSRDFYRSRQEEVTDEAGKDIFGRLADEEDLHCRILESIVDFVARPEAGNWLENAEWFHQDDY